MSFLCGQRQLIDSHTWYQTDCRDATVDEILSLWSKLLKNKISRRHLKTIISYSLVTAHSHNQTNILTTIVTNKCCLSLNFFFMLHRIDTERNRPHMKISTCGLWWNPTEGALAQRHPPKPKHLTQKQNILTCGKCHFPHH